MALHVPMVIFTYGSNSPSADTSAWSKQFNIMEIIHLAGFCMQENIISAIYMVNRQNARLDMHSSTRKMMIKLILINSPASSWTFF